MSEKPGRPTDRKPDEWQKDPARQEFTAMGVMEAEPNNWYVPKTEVPYWLWNRLIGVENPERLDESNQ